MRKTECATKLFLYAAIISVLATSVVNAATIYNYVGKPFNGRVTSNDVFDSSDSITAMLTLPEPLGSNSFGRVDVNYPGVSLKLSSNRFTIDSANVPDGSTFTLNEIYFRTNGLGEIVQWRIDAELETRVDGPNSSSVTNLLRLRTVGPDDSPFFLLSDDRAQLTTTTRDAAGNVIDRSFSRGLNVRSPGDWTRVPEPSGAVLLALGSIAIAVRRR